MTAWIPHSRPTLPAPSEWASVTERLTPGWIEDGPCVSEFTTQAAGWLAARTAVAVNSGTCALHLGLLAAGVTPGSEVLVPAYCCAAVLHAVHLARANPVLVEAERDGFSICWQDAFRRATRHTAAIVVAHLFGHPVWLSPFRQLGVPIVEDCAQSLGSATAEGGSLTGSQGAVSIVSFAATKVITTGAGGLAACRDEQGAATLRDLVDYDKREDWSPRFSYSMSELQAALGLWQLERLPAFLERRRQIAEYFDAELGDGLRVLTPAAGGNRYRYCVWVRQADRFIAAFQAHGIDAKRPVYRPLHHYLGGHYPDAQAAHEQIVSLPIYPTLTDSDVEKVVSVARLAAGD